VTDSAPEAPTWQPNLFAPAVLRSNVAQQRILFAEDEPKRGPRIKDLPGQQTFA
jgi:hypothetical protein